MPREIFEFTPTRDTILGEANGEGEQVERIEFNKGTFIFLKGHPYPQKGIPTVEAIAAINVVKKLLKEGIKTFAFYLIPRRSLNAFAEVGMYVLGSFILKYEFQTPTTQAVNDLLTKITGDRRIGMIVSHVLEYDQAYRFRLQDLCSGTSKERFLRSPIREIKRLLEINRRRDYKVASDKIHLLKPLIYLLLIPPLRKKFKRAIQSIDFTKLQFDEGDRYWALKKTDYDYGGTHHPV